MSQDGSESTPSTKTSQNGAEHRSADQSAAAAAAAKRKSSRTTGAKNSLRRVAIIAQQPGGRVPGASTSTTPEVEVDGATSISAICVAESFNMEMVKDILQAHGFQLDPDGAGFEAAEVVHARGFSNGDIFVFPSGTVVTWSLPQEVVTRLATRQLLRAAEDPHVRRAELEDLEYVSDPSRDTSGMKGDVVVLGTKKEEREGDRLDTTLAKIAFSSGLARSTKLAVLESSLTAYLEETRRIPAQLSKGSRMALSRKFILQKTGELLSLRAQLNHYWELTDSLPDIFWDQSSELGLEGYYDQVGKALDVNVRIKALNQKMDYAQEIASVLREMSSEKHNTRLEWIIIILIAVEVLFELRRVYMDYMETREKPHVEETAEHKLNYDDLS
ncbi:putative family protein [Phaeoacremonium minimum UCRPA7]|uniref:Putative family protein n=1 Tax=Phaeoacremonium minimum (strain UCR-PA7) TaxID=1286976 RepID=R8BRN9_PHAM7|nr:putative family protein [Phaeoacremonium minimum UCRPA7]EOO01989.1 putative family protein [Phaeoacremonium minimum UCRPA7]